MDFLTETSKKRFDTLNNDTKPIFEEFLNLCHANKFNVQVTSGSRTVDEQDNLYALGRTKAGRIITNAKGGQSAHNYGIAMDVVVINRLGECDWRFETYEMIAKLAQENGLMEKGLFWAGEWKTFKEAVHFDLSNGRPIDEIKIKYPLYEA